MINYNYDCSACVHRKICRIIPRDIIDFAYKHDLDEFIINFAYKHDLDEFITVDVNCNYYIALLDGPKTNRKED